MMIRLPPAVALLAAALLLAAAACGEKAAQPPAPAKGQIVAQIGKEDVTVFELDNEYRVLGITTDKVTPDVTRRVIREIVTRKYLAQRAVAAGLDREPTVLLGVMRVRAQILAQSLVSRDVQGKVSSLGRFDIDKYIYEHPASFAKRIKINTDQISVPITSEAMTFLQSNLDVKSLAEIETRLSAGGIRFIRTSGAIFSGDVPDSLFNQLIDKKVGDILFIRSGDTGAFIDVKSREPAPLEGEPAAQKARQLMSGEIAREELAMNSRSVESEVKYFERYADLMKDDMAGQSAPIPTPAGVTPQGEARP